MTLNEKILELIGELPEELQPYAEQYIPVLQNMAMNEIIAMISLLIDGKTLDAYRTLAMQMGDEALLEEIDNLNSDIDSANEANAASIAKQRSILLAILTTAVGLLAKNLYLGE